MTSYTILYIVLAAIISFMVVFFQYFYKEKNRGRMRMLLSSLRFLSLFSLLLLLINPQIKSNQLLEIQPELNIVVDNSSSIAYAKQEDKITSFVKELRDNKEINNKFNVNYFSFSDDLYQQDTFTFNKSETNILKTLQTLQSLNKETISPTVLITDGNQTYGSSYQFYKSKDHLYPVVVGDTIQYDDIRISQLNVNSYTTLNNQFPVEAFLQYEGKKPISKEFTIRQKGIVVYKKVLDFSEQINSQRIQLYLKPDSIGIHNYSCSISYLDNEKNTINNLKNFNIEVIDEQSKILIVSDIKHPDVSMIKRSIESNKQRKVIVENNLSKNIEINDYQLIVLYQPNNKFNKILTNINAKESNFFVITGSKTDWNFLNVNQPYFTKNTINKTEEYSAEFNTSYDEFIIEDFRFSNFSPLEGYFGEVNFSVSYKSILFQSIDNFTLEAPLLTTFEVANRRGAVLFGENSWKWRMLTKVEQQSFNKFDIFFNKLVQYLSSDKRSSQLEINYKPFVYANSDVVIMAQFFDRNYVFDKNANLLLSLTNSETKENRKIPLALKNNTFEAIISNLNPGEYVFTVSESNQNINKAGSFTVLNYDIEQQLTASNITDLKKIAEVSNGNIFNTNENNQLLSQLLSDKRYQTTQKSIEKTVSLIDWKWLLALVVFFFGTEWFIRKYRGLI